MQRQFKTDQIVGDQKVALMEYAGFNDMELFMSKQITATEFKDSMKQQMKDQLIQNVLQNGGMDINNPFIRKSLFGDIDDAETFTMGMLEPMQSIIRLMRVSDASYNAANTQKIKDYGKKLLKKYQYEQFNTDNGNVFTDNIDEIMLASGDDRKTVIRDILEQSMYQNIQDPIDRAMMHYLTAQRRDSANAAKYKTQIKDLQTIKIFQSSVPRTSPVTNDNLYAFYRMVNGQVQAADVLNIALGEELGPISELDFERYFGSPAKQFSCRSHTDTIRVPCGVQLKADECVAAGCCYQEATGGVPSCFHDLYGKIGSGMLRRAWFKDSDITNQISGLFVDKTIPTLDKILRDSMPEELYGSSKYAYTAPVGNAKGTYAKATGLNAVEMKGADGKTIEWWNAAHVTDFEEGPNGANVEPKRTGTDGGARLWNQRQPARTYGRKDFQWTPHGPTQSPFFDNMPGVNPTANPLDNGMGSLDDYYKIWLEYAAVQDQAQCALIPENNRVKCMENFEALVDDALTTLTCKNAGCCFNEDSFLAGKPACYRATDYGKCRNLPPNYQKTECGYEGIDEASCLNNAQCCYEPSANRKDPWCFKKYSATLEESQWCAAWSEERYRNVAREPCFNVATAKSNGKSNFFLDDQAHNINNLVSEEQCTANDDCCFDSSLSADYLDWLTEGLGYAENKMYRCFKKRNPLIAAQTADLALINAGKSETVDGSQENKLVNLNKYGDGSDKENPHTYTARVKTCNNNQWEIYGAGKTGLKRSCGDNLTYYQCVYQKRCCYKATVSNEPVCYYPEFKAGTGYPSVSASKDGTIGRD